MERYNRPIMTLEEIEEEVYTIDAATGTTMISGDATIDNTPTPFRPVKPPAESPEL